MAVDRRSDLAMALAMCRSCCINACDVHDVAWAIVREVRRAPPDKRHAAAIRVLKRAMARQFGVPVRSLPNRLRELKAAAQYDTERARRATWQAEDRQPWGHAFDYHSKRFAAETGVCPRCTRREKFTRDAGACACGFRYGRQGRKGHPARRGTDGSPGVPKRT